MANWVGACVIFKKTKKKQEGIIFVVVAGVGMNIPRFSCVFPRNLFMICGQLGTLKF
jgi:hypothetical protein